MKKGPNRRQSRQPRNSLLTKVILGALLFVLLLSFLGFSSKKGIRDNIVRYAGEIQKKCENAKLRSDCYRNHFYGFTKQTDFDTATKTLLELKRLDPEQTRDCHIIGHKIAEAETEKDPDSWKDVLAKVDPMLCTGGFMHGVLEVHSRVDRAFRIDSNSASSVCSVVHSEGQGSCFHIIGHLFLVQEEKDIEKAAVQCQSLATSLGINQCLSGTFMENITNENLYAHGMVPQLAYWDVAAARRIEKDCAKFTGLAEKVCWREIPHLYIAIVDNDPIKLLAECRRNAPTLELAEECYIFGAGRMVVVMGFDETKLKNVCHHFKESDPVFVRCMKHTADIMVKNSTDNVERIMNLCEMTYEAYKPRCYENIISTLRSNKISPDFIQETCRSLPKEIGSRACRGSS